ncbi:hypothetical protein [Anatilimnocola floriformis]|uniref:hypothetical protein n=1 Tax=Anatilimnocola floriformis TaxID=2948575 RepID=UPI0020C27CC5|nr:hypothetical protein [Anatilimnocola floriformis]
MVDTITNLTVAEIVVVGRDFKWKRKTSPLLHGAPPAEGVAKGLAQAKVDVFDGLPK